MTGTKIWKAHLFHNINEGESPILDNANSHDCTIISPLKNTVLSKWLPRWYHMTTYYKSNLIQEKVNCQCEQWTEVSLRNKETDSQYKASPTLILILPTCSMHNFQNLVLLTKVMVLHLPHLEIMLLSDHRKSVMLV